ncbi:MAG: hypothetical protein F4X37_06750 [Acidimicrobiia bacterium]|nr:hypothetical protein [Acidimicrobiia bacterium]
MYVGFRSSGGRGEYELVGRHGDLVAAQLSNWTLRWDLPDLGKLDTNLQIDPGRSGKARLRRVRDNGPQIGRQIAAILLMPFPTRSARQLSIDAPILRADSYRVTRIGVGIGSTFDATTQTLAMTLAYIEVANRTLSELHDFHARWQRISVIHRRISHLPKELADAIKLHLDALRSNSISDGLIPAARQVAHALNEDSLAEGTQHDLVGQIESILAIDSTDIVVPPTPDLVDYDSPEVRLRAASEWRSVRSRGASGQRFAREVKEAYDHQCAFCGLRLPSAHGLHSGVDAAHILPWANYDLNVICNGVCLCKIHHWTFDQSVLCLQHLGDAYVVIATRRIEALDAAARQFFAGAVGRIPDHRLPLTLADRPRHAFLDILNGTIASSLGIKGDPNYAAWLDSG